MVQVAGTPARSATRPCCPATGGRPWGRCAHLDDVLAGAVVHLRVRVVVCGGGVHAARHLTSKRITRKDEHYIVTEARVQPAAFARAQAPLSLDSETGHAGHALRRPGMLAAAAPTPAAGLSSMH